jgi:S-layer protein (TIGR01567 family)
MKQLILIVLIFLSTALLAPSVAREIRGNIYAADDGIIQWNADNFAGFYPGGSEKIQLNISGQQIKTGAAEYRSEVQNHQIEHKAWGSYSAICFLGHEYFAGYPEDCLISDPLSLFSQEYNLRTVLMDSDDSYTIESDQTLPLQEGYNLKLSDAEDGVRVSLYKGEKMVDSRIVQPPEDYIYKASIANQNTTLIAVAIKGNVKLVPKSHYTVKGIFQVSEETMTIAAGTEYESLTVDFMSENEIRLINPESLNLSKGQDLDLIDDFFIKTSSIDSSSERLYIYKNTTDSSTSEIRGEIASGGFSWTPQNFAGFYYDVDQDLGSEEITTTITDNSNLIEPNGIIYYTTAQKKEFRFKEWGHYNAIAFLGDSYIAGYVEDSLLGQSSEDSNLLSSEKLARILIDSREPNIIKDGSKLILEEGLEAGISVDKSCSKALIELYDGGELIDMDYVELPNTYIYKKMLEGTGEIAVLALHISDQNCTPGNSFIVDGIFQISEVPVDVSVDLSFGDLRIASVSTDTITMDNREKTIRLNNKVDALLAGNYYIKAFDSELATEPPKYYIFKSISALANASGP